MARSAISNEQQSSPDNRPSKRVRVSNTRERSRSPPRSAGVIESTPRTRGPTACEKCRSRKTRCDNRRPCGYCAKHQIPCVYDDNDATSAPSVTGEQILEAIGNLSDLVRSQGHQHTPSCRCIDRSYSVISYPDPGSVRPYDLPYSALNNGNATSADLPAGSPTRQPPLQSQGVESILSWEPLSSYQPLSCTFGDYFNEQPPTSRIPNIEYRELTRLEAKYTVGVHLKNPILDLEDLHSKILQVGENGLDWSTRTCLVTLVCAIGALTQRYQDPDNVHVTTPSPGIVRSSLGCESETELAMQFWGIAARRLGFAIGENNVEAVQCLCLAGIWYMHRLDPLQAWKHFNLAGAAWHALNMMDELKFEIDVPGPILDNVEFPHAFPLPPNLSNQVLSPGHAEAEKCWYYYLAEIAARHMLNRVLRTHSWRNVTPTERVLRQMVAHADELEVQAQQWHSSLPPMFSFEVPTGFSMQIPPDEQTNILRHRYLGCRDLIGRPFLRLCVENPLEIDPWLRSRVASLASQSLRFCMLKLDQATPQLHQGSWFVLRNITSSSLIMGAATIAKKRPWLHGAQELLIPPGWREKIVETADNIDPFWEHPGCGAPEMRRIVQAVLDGCEDDH